MTDQCNTKALVGGLLRSSIPAFIPRDYPRPDNSRWFTKHATADFPDGKFFTFCIQPIGMVNGSFVNRNRLYSFFDTLEELQSYVFKSAAHHRCLEEVIKPNTPHRFALDLERDDLSEDQVEEYKSFVFEMFLPLLARFFTDFFGREVREQHFSVLFACSVKKFSTHIALIDGSYFAVREQGMVVAVALETFLYRVDDDTFKRLYKWNEGDKVKCLVDYSVHHAGSRNWRTFTGIKIPKKDGKPGLYANFRPLLPSDRDMNRPWTDFFVTAITRRDFLIDLSAEQIMVIRDQYNNIPYAERSKKTFSRTTREPVRVGPIQFARGAAAQNLDAENVWNFSYETLTMYRKRLNDIRLSQHNYERLITVARKLASDLSSQIHPFNTGSWQQEKAGELCRLRISARVFTEQGEPVYRSDGNAQRLCYFSYAMIDGPCERGSHQCDISVMVNLSVMYHCFACNNQCELLPSPFSKSTIRPRFYDSGIPDVFGVFEGERLNYINYGELQTNCIRMRKIGQLPNGQLVGATKRTIILHGSMGSGKTFVTSQFIKDSGVNRILSITFRVMLAESNAVNFDLEFYNSDLLPSGCLSNIDKLAIQLDSLERLAEKDDAMKKLVFRKYDLIILDESESILNHINAKTLENKKNKIFQFLEHLVRYANNVIVADADLGPRTHEFIAGTRSESYVEYHRNPFVLKNIQYIDYKFFHTWISSVMFHIFEAKKNVFVVSNCKKALFYLEGLVNLRLGELEIDDPYFVKVLSSDLTGNEKKLMAANCAVEWKRYRVLMISPVVGAGISFDEEHYHECFVYATPFSSVPREVCQLQGRVRNLIDNRVHVYIDENHAYFDKKETSTGENSKIKQKRLKIRQKESINVEFDGFDDDIGLINFRVRDERLMNKICLLSDMEKLKGRTMFRMGLIEVLQRNNPTLNYRFEKQGNWTKENETQSKYHKFKYSYDGFMAENIANREGLEQYDVAKRRNQKGLLVSDDREVQETLVPSLIYEETKRVLGFDKEPTNEDREMIALYLQLFGTESCDLENAVADFYALHFLTTSQTLRLVDKKTIKPTFIEIDRNEVEKGRTQMALSVDYLKSTLNQWISRLFFLNGADEASDLCFHSSLCKERLLTEAAQKELREEIPLMQVAWSGLPGVNVQPSKVKQYSALEVFVTPRAMSNIANFVLQRVLHTGGLEKSVPCSVHDKCKIKRPNTLKTDILNLLCLRKTWNLDHRDIFESKRHVVQSLYPLVPCFGPLDESMRISYETFGESVRELQILENLKFEKKRKQKESLDAAKLNEKYEKSILPFVDDDVLETDEQGNFTMHRTKFYEKVFDPAYKTRTKRYMADCESCMERKRRCVMNREFLYE